MSGSMEKGGPYSRELSTCDGVSLMCPCGVDCIGFAGGWAVKACSDGESTVEGIFHTRAIGVKGGIVCPSESVCGRIIRECGSRGAGDWPCVCGKEEGRGRRVGCATVRGG